MKYLEAVTVSVNYSDYLRFAIPKNKQHFDRWIIVTSEEDKTTQSICQKHEVECITTNRLCENRDVFNKAKALNDGLNHLEKKEWILTVDSDILLTEGFRERFDSLSLSPDVLYGAIRLTPKTLDDLSDYLRGEFNTKRWRNHDFKKYSTGECRPWGYFQIFTCCDVLKNRNTIFSENYRYANEYDDEFIDLWPEELRKFQWNVIHMPHTGFNNWGGRVSPKITL